MKNQITKIGKSNKNSFSLLFPEYLGILLVTITSLTLLGCEETNSPSVYTRSTTSNSTSQNVDTDTEVEANSSIEPSNCQYSQQVDNIIDKLSKNGNFINIEIGKQAYLKLKFHDSCSPESQRLSRVLKAHWTKSSFDDTLAAYTMCIANCLGSQESSCSAESCEQERSRKIDSENEAIRSFFR